MFSVTKKIDYKIILGWKFRLHDANNDNLLDRR